MIDEQTFNALSDELNALLKKYNVEVTIRSELSFNEIKPDGENVQEQVTESSQAN